jgi:[acyl-carrier-protein] S-malonyltransferase
VDVVIAVFAPGQGAQAPGMLAAWLELPGVAEQVAGFSEATGLDLARLGTTAGADEIKDTAVTQPLLVAAGVIAADRLGLLEPSGAQRLVAGHSVGELTAAAVTGALSPAAAVAFAGRRGAEMAAACALSPTGMSAVLGGDADAVTARLDALGLTPANVNGGGQVVAAGPLDALAELTQAPPAKARVVPLQVAGAFHTRFMADAVERLETLARAVSPRDAVVGLLSNADGAVVTDGREAVTRLVAQIANPVRWDLCQETLVARGVTGMLELAPGGVLSGLAKRTLRGVETVAVKTPDDLEAAADLIRRHGSAGGPA